MAYFLGHPGGHFGGGNSKSWVYVIVCAQTVEYKTAGDVNLSAIHSSSISENRQLMPDISQGRFKASTVMSQR